MANELKKAKRIKVPTPRQVEISRLREKGRGARTDQENARLDQLGKEERRDRFLRLAVKRRNNTLRQMRNVERMANRNVYDYTPEEAVRIVASLEQGMESVRRAFAAKKTEDFPDAL